MVDSSDKTWSTGEGNGKPLPYSCLENPMNRQRDMYEKTKRTLKDELPRLEGAQYSGGEWRTGEIAPEGMKRLSQRENNAKLWWSK